MSNKDSKYINFSEDHELNYILSKYKISNSELERNILKDHGKNCKLKLGKTILEHDEFYSYLESVDPNKYKK